MGNLYDYPASALNVIRRILSQDLDVRLEGPSKVALMVYDNGTFIVESFLDEPVTVQVVVTDGKVSSLTDIVTEKSYLPTDGKSSYRVTLMPHSYKVFKKETK